MRHVTLVTLFIWPILFNSDPNSLSQSQFVPPVASAQTLKGVPWRSANAIGGKFHNRFIECDTKDLCDGEKIKYGCKKDQNRNTTILKFPNGVIFFDAKLGLDADGSPLSRKNPSPTDQSETSFRFNVLGKPSVDSDKIPFIVIPSGDFDKELGVVLGDIAAVIFKDKLIFALVADKGPPCKVGEGSIELHQQLGHNVCLSRNATGECSKLRDIGINGEVLYFIFPHSAIPGLTPANAKQRIAEQGLKQFNNLLTINN